MRRSARDRARADARERCARTNERDRFPFLSLSISLSLSLSKKTNCIAKVTRGGVPPAPPTMEATPLGTASGVGTALGLRRRVHACRDGGALLGAQLRVLRKREHETDIVLGRSEKPFSSAPKETGIVRFALCVQKAMVVSFCARRV